MLNTGTQAIISDMSTCIKPLFDTLKELPEQDPPESTNASQRNTWQLTYDFLISYRGSEATFNSYRRELERFLHWLWQVRKMSLNAVKRQDIEAFIEFCQKPPIDWVGHKQVSRFITKDGERTANPDWRPFVTTGDAKYHTLSPKALQAIFGILSSFFSYLIQEDVIGYNPVAQIRQKSKYLRKSQQQAPIRRLSELQWAYVLETTEQMAAAEPAVHERSLFIMNALYGMYLRISELAASDRWLPQMGHFHQDHDGNWWFRTVGKGNKERIIAVSDAMLSALKRYRHSLNLSELPYPGENTPLLSKTRGRGPITSTRQIRSIVQVCFDRAIAHLQKDDFKHEAEQLSAATVHWLRHTGISDDVKHRPREHVRDDAGHGSSAITDRYIDVELRERHRSAKRKQIKTD